MTLTSVSRKRRRIPSLYQWALVPIKAESMATGTTVHCYCRFPLLTCALTNLYPIALAVQDLIPPGRNFNGLQIDIAHVVRIIRCYGQFCEDCKLFVATAGHLYSLRGGDCERWQLGRRSDLLSGAGIHATFPKLHVSLSDFPFPHNPIL